MNFFLASAALIFVLSSCQDKTLQWLNKKWDCVKIDNLDPLDKKTFTSAADSAAADKIESALKDLNWSFNKDGSYLCSVGDKTVTQGTYQLSEDEKILVCTPLSKNTVNRYTIIGLSEDELILSNNSNNVNLVMHFKSH